MIQETRLKLKTLRLAGLLRAWDGLVESGADKSRTIDELLAYLVDAECEERYQRKVSRCLKNAKLRLRASLTEFDTVVDRGVDRLIIARLSEGEWIRQAENILITGATGTGKSYLACALGHRACALGHRVSYFSTAKLLRALRDSLIDNSFSRLLKTLARQEVLILDDFGLEKLGKEERRWLLEIVEDRHGLTSTIIVSQFPPNLWAEIIGDPTIADAIIDRLIHSAKKLELKKEKDSRRAKASRVDLKKPS
jgi:DNA replication protein DnaC